MSLGELLALDLVRLLLVEREGLEPVAQRRRRHHLQHAVDDGVAALRAYIDNR